jgi:hypothetical protein
VTNPVRRLLGGVSTITVIAAVGGLALPVGAAQASMINLTACNISPLSQPFAPWLDPASYELAPGGDFETSSWTLAGGARRVPGSESFAVTGALGSHSLDLPAGASAQSPSTCVDAAYPTIRFFASGTGRLEVSVVYGDVTIPAGVTAVAGDWSPTPVMLTEAAIMSATSDGSAQVSLRFDTLAGDVRADDVFVDPWNRG